MGFIYEQIRLFYSYTWPSARHAHRRRAVHELHGDVASRSLLLHSLPHSLLHSLLHSHSRRAPHELHGDVASRSLLLEYIGLFY
jgi:hypothetical protein